MSANLAAMGELLTVAQTAELLGVARSTVRWLRGKGDLTALKNSEGRLRFDKDEAITLKARRECFLPAKQKVG